MKQIRFRPLICFLLALALILGPLASGIPPVSATQIPDTAPESAPGAQPTEPVAVPDPLPERFHVDLPEYGANGTVESLPVSEEIRPASLSAGSYNDAVALVRQAMVDRKYSVEVLLQGQSLTFDQTLQLVNDAMAHTGVPNEGDYLRYSMGGYSYGLETGTNANGVYSLVYYNFEWYTTEAQEAEMDTAVSNLLAELNVDGMTDYQKIRTIYDYISDNISYDYDHLNSDPSYKLMYTAYAALTDQTAVCQGIAALFYRLCLEKGIDCRVVTGDAGDERHAWNITRLEGLYYNMDPTWDLNLSVYYRYFLCTEHNFVNHTRDPEFTTSAFMSAYPMAQVPYGVVTEASGTLSTGLYWYLDTNGCLTISGQGAIPDFKSLGAPWYPYAESVLKIVLEEGVTRVGNYSFVRCKYASEVVFPSTLTSIGSYGFDNCRSLRTLNLPSSVTTLSNNAFSECSALTSLVLPDTVTSVGYSAFSNCQNLLSATLSKGMTTIPNSMFFNCIRLNSVTIPSSITSIEDTVFRRCSGLYTLTIPAQVTSIGVAAFADCTSLTSIKVASGNQHFTSVNGVLFTKDMKTLISYPAGIYGSYTIPEGVTTLARASFGSSKISSVTFPDSLTRIEIYAFTWCHNLKSVTIGPNVTYIGANGFAYNNGLTTVVFEGEDVTFEDSVFYDCISLKNVTLPSKLKKLGEYMFSGCDSLKEIAIPETVTALSDSCFTRCEGLVSITLPASIRTVGDRAFSRCSSLQTVTFLGNITSMAREAFGECDSLRLIRFVGDLSGVKSNSFDDTVMKSVYFDNQAAVSRIYGRSSYGNMLTNIKSIAIAQSVETIPSFVRSNFPYHTGILYQGQTYVLYADHACSWTYDSGRRCSVCNAMRDSTSHVHAYAREVVYPTCTEEGYTIFTCDCGDSYIGNYVPAEGHFFYDGICMSCGYSMCQFQSATISLTGNIALNFYVVLDEEILSDENAYMSFTMADGTVKTAMLSGANTNIKDGVTRYIFTCELHAKQMADMVVAQMHLSDGSLIGNSKEYSVVTYAGYIIANEATYAPYYPTLIPLLKTMLNYGTYSQIHFGYNTNNPANAGLGLALEDVTVDQLLTYKPKTAGSLTGLKAASVTLILRSETVLRFYFSLSAGHNINDYRFMVAGNSVWPKYNPDNGRYYVEVTNIAAKNLDQTYGVTVTNAEGTESLSVVASAMSYGYQVLANPSYFTQDLKDLVKAMYAYAMAANSYFG